MFSDSPAVILRFHTFFLVWDLKDINASADLISSGSLFQNLKALIANALVDFVSNEERLDERLLPEDLEVLTGSYSILLRGKNCYRG